MFGTPASSWMSASPLEILITRACEPSLPEPNYALQLEIAEYINQKKANTPREAAMLLVRLANHRNPHVGMLALSTLDTLVQACGYPFQLQIATKEFLNELVRRFPERPPPFPGAVMQRILDLINGWKEGICQDSRWKQDLGNIRDMHRLLTFKGYRFRDAPRTQPATSAASTLKSAEELEEEDRAAQSAKLQELIRRGTPRDLAAAQDIMKTLAGADPDAKPDYRAQALADIAKLEQKVVLLNELLDNFDITRNERFASGDAYDQISQILSSARPKVQKWISDAETDDPESLDTYLQVNDGLNSVLNRYDAFKRGDYTAAVNPIPPELEPSAGGAGSLIDLDDSDALASLGGFGAPAVAPAAAAPAVVPSASPAAPTPDLFSLLDGTAPAVRSPPQNGFAGAYQQSAASGGMVRMGGSRSGTPGTPMGSIALPSTPRNSMPAMQQPAGGMGMHAGVGMGALAGMQPFAGSGPSMGAAQAQQPAYFGGARQAQPMQPQAPTTAAPAPAPAPAQGKDPFADLAGIF